MDFSDGLQARNPYGLPKSNNKLSSAFSDCNSDRSGEFPMPSSKSRRLLIACASDNSDDLIRQLVSDLESCSIDEQKQAVMEIRLLAKNKSENRLKIARAGAIKPLISLISSSDPQLQENGVTAILNLSLCDENKELIASSGAIKLLTRALRIGTSTAKENAACALLRLSQMEENKIAIGRSGAIPLLVNLLETGKIRGKKDASTALYTICSVKENKIRAVDCGIMKPLVELMADFGSNMVDKSAFVVSVLVSVTQARAAFVEEGGIPVLVEIVEVGSQRQKEIAVAILLQICEESVVYRTMVAREGAIPPLVALSQSGTSRTKQKSLAVLEKNTREASNSEGMSTSLFSLEDLQRLFGSKREDAANILGVSVSTFKRICRHHGIKRWPNRIRNNVWEPPNPQGEKNASPTCKTLSANGQTATWYELVGHLQEPNEFPPDLIGGPNCWNTGNGSLEDILRATTFHDSCPDNYLDMGSSIPPMFKESGEAMGSYEWAFQLRDQSTVSTSYLNPNALVFPQHQKASIQMVSDNMRISEDWRQPQIASTQMVSENMGISEDWRQHQIASKQMVSENMEILEDCRNCFASPAEAFMEGLVSGSSNWTLPTCSNPALSQTTTTIRHLMPYLPASQDLRSVTLKATYGDTMIRFQLPLTSGIAELKEEVSLRLKLELGSFDVEYKDEDGDWILIGCDKDLRDYLQLFSSFGNQVIRLLVIDKVPNATNFSGSCGLKRKRP